MTLLHSVVCHGSLSACLMYSRIVEEKFLLLISSEFNSRFPQRYTGYSELIGVTYGICLITLSTATDPRSVGFRYPSHLCCMNFSDASVVSDQNSVLVKVYEFKTG
jgi:hypothetical protein